MRTAMRRGIESADREGTVPQEEMERRLEKWFSK